jgi:transcriptional regulator with XRE-family HTH domain
MDAAVGADCESSEEVMHMPRNGPSFGGGGGGSRAHPGDIGRRVIARREELGLTREQVASRAGMSPGYVRYVEERAADASTVALLRLAGALDTTPDELRGGGEDQPVGRGQAAYHPALREMNADECRDHLSTHGVGRVAVTTRTGAPVVVPVNYSIVGDDIVYRTSSGAASAPPEGADVAFEVDHIDDAFSQGWSVLVMGRARHVTEPQAVHRLAERSYSPPWAGGDRDLWIRIEPAHMTGRRISVG